MAKIKGHLTLVGDDFNPNNVSSKLKVQPKWVRTKHELLGNGQEFGHYEWGVDTDSIEHYDLEPVVKQLIEFMEPRVQLLAEVAKDCCAVWNILFDISSTEDFPVANLSIDFIRLAAEINAEVGFDPIIYPTQHESRYSEDYPFKDSSESNIMAKMKGHIFLIGDDVLIPDEVAAQLDDQPNRAKTKREFLENGQELCHYGCGADTDLIEHYDLDPVVNELVAFMKSRIKLLAEVARKNGAVWKILFDISSTEEFPATYFGVDFIRLAAEINAEVGLDVTIHPTV